MSFEETIENIVRRVVREELMSSARSSNADDLLTYDEAAAFAKVSKTTINDWRKNGLLPVQRQGRVVRVLRGDVVNAMKTTVAPPHDSPDDWAANKLARRSRRRDS